jgi:hypothetical protein
VCRLRHLSMLRRSLKALGGFPPALFGVNDGGGIEALAGSAFSSPAPAG